MFLFILLSTVWCGLIETLDYSIDYLNVGYTTQFSFTFRLQSGLGLSGYLSLKIPFQIEGSLSGTVPQGVSVIYNEVSTTDCTPISEFPGALFKDSSGWYHVQFLNLDGDPRALEAGIYYRVSITSISAFNNQIVGIQSSIEAQTIQDFSVSWIKYDYNRMFALLEFTSAPSNSLVASFTLQSSTPTLLDYRHSLIINIKPTKPMERSSRILIKMTDSHYQFQGEQCTSESYTLSNGTVIAALTSTQYKCQIVNNVLTVNLFQIFNDTLQFSFSILNPKFVKSSGGGFTVMTLLSYANHIVEYTTVNNILTTSALTWGTSNANLVTYFLWGLKLSDTTLPSIFSIIRDNNVNPYFNSFKFTFYPSATTPLNLKLRVTLTLHSDPGSIILEGSLQENLPQFDKNPVSCSVTQTQPITVICTNVGSLTISGIYFIAIKMYFPYQAVPSALPSDFGNIMVESASDGTNYDPIPLIAAGRDNGPSYTTQNGVSLAGNKASNGYTFAHSQPFSDPFSCPSSSSFGLQYADYEQRLLFTAQPPINFFQGSSGAATTGYQLYTNPKIQKGSSTLIAESPLGLTPAGTCSPTPASYTASHFILSGVAQDDFINSSKYTLLKILNTPTGTATQSAVFGGNAASDVFTVSIGPVIIKNNGTQYCSEDLIDFIGQSVEFSTPNIPIKGIIATNSYTLSGPNKMTNLYISVVNFWTGTTSNLDGTLFPAFVRVTGFLDQSVVDKSARLAIFFSNLSPFNEGLSPEGKQYVSCSSTMNRKQQCYGFTGSQIVAQQSVYHLNRVEFILDDTLAQSGPASPFQLVIPVTTITNKNKLQFFIATISENQEDKIYSNFIAFKSQIIEQTLAAPTATMNKNAGITLDAISYKLDLVNFNPRVGDSDTTAQVYYGHTQATAIIAPNSGTSQGAAFFYQGKWSMIGPSFDTKALILNPGLTYQQKCVPYHYNTFVGFLCPMVGDTVITAISQYIQIVGFNYPYQSVQTPSGGYSGWSDNSGNMQSFSTETVNTLNTGQLQLPTITKSIIIRGYQDQIVQWQFTTINSIPKDGYVKMGFTSGSWPFSVNTASKCQMKTSADATQIDHTCTITTTSGVEIRFTLLAAVQFPPDTYTIIQYGVNMPDTSASDQTYSVITYTSGGLQIDATSVGAAILKFYNTPLGPSIKVDGVVFERVNTGMRGQFQFNFQLVNRGILYNQHLQFVIAMIATTTVAKTTCQILNQDGSTSFDWKSFNGVTFSMITIMPVGDLDPGNKYIFRCFNVITPATYIAPQVQMFSGTTQLSTGTAINDPIVFDVAPVLLTTSSLAKLFSLPTSMLQVTINLILSSQFNSTSTLYVNLPYYYNSYDNQKSLSCQINNTDAYCQYSNERTIKIKLFTLTIEALQPFNVTIIGIVQPPSSYNDDSLFIMIDYDTVESTISEYGTLSDVATASTISTSLLIRDFDITNTAIRTESQYTYYIEPLASVLVGQYLVIDFPSNDYGKLVQLKPPSSCNGYLENNITTIILSKCSSIGNRLLMPFETAVDANTKLVINIFGMTNMEASSCYIALPTLFLVNTDQTQIQQLSTKVYANIPQFKLEANSSTFTIYWKQETSSDITYTLSSSETILRLNYNELTLKPGQFSDIISLGLLSQGYNKELTFTISSNSGTFQVINELSTYPGDGKALTRIGCLGATNPQAYYLYFTKSEEEPMTYSDAGIIQVMISTTQTKVSTQYSEYEIPLFLTSIPVLIDFSDMIPVEDLILNLELIPFNETDSPGLKFGSNSDTTMTVDVTQKSLKITFTVVSTVEITSISADHYCTLQITFTGSSANYYTQSTPLTKFILINPINNIKKTALIYTMTLNQLSDYSNKQIINFSSTQHLTIYYHVTMLNGFQRYYDNVKVMAENNTQLKYADYYQEQVGVLFVKANTIYPFTLRQLKARTWYKIKSWAINQYEMQNETDYIEFVTQNNNGRLLKLTFNFGTLLSNIHKLDISCWLCYSFAYPCYNLLSYDAIYCKNSTFKNLTFNSTQVYSKYRMLETTATTDESSDESTDESSDESSDESNTESVNSAVQYYFLPNQDLPTDNNWKQVIAGVQDTHFLRYFVGNLTNSTRLYSINELEEVTFDKSPEIISTLKFTRGLTWLYIYNIRLRDTGLVWGYITPKFASGELAINGKTPTNIQMKYFADCLNQTITNYFISYYETDSIAYNFTNLSSSKWYKIYLIATQDSPSLWAETSKVYTYENKTLRKSFDEPATVYGTILLSLITFWLF